MTTEQHELPSRRAPRPTRDDMPKEENPQSAVTLSQHQMPVQRQRVSMADLFDTSKMDIPKSNLDNLDMSLDATDAVINLNNSPYLLDLVKRSMEDGRPIWYDIPRYTVPGGGNNAFAGFNGRMENELEGVVLAIHNIRQFYIEEKTDDSPSALPICVSIDTKNGFGNPGGKCQTCPHRQRNPSLPTYCRRKTWMFIIRPSDDLPTLIDLTGAASMGLNSQQIEDSYLRNKLPVGVNVESIVSRFHLESHPNYNTGNRKASIIKGEPIARVDWANADFQNGLNFAKTYIQGVVENWLDYMVENVSINRNVSADFVEGSVSATNHGNADMPNIPDDIWDDDDELPF